MGRLTAHVDVLPTLAELADARLSAEVAAQVEGRSLVPLLKDPNAPWADRTLTTHVGRWPKGEAPLAKYRQCSVRTAAWHLVSAAKGAGPSWELYDVKADPGEKDDVSASHPDVVKELSTAYDTWWNSVQPALVNEDAVGPAENPFTELYRKQFGPPLRRSP